MTAQMMARDAFVMISMETYRPAVQVSGDPIIARMDTIEAQGTYDVDDMGLRRARQGRVGGDMMTCQVAALGSDTLITFWSVSGDGHQRRFLVDALGRTWMDTKRGQAVRQATKYDEAIARIMAARSN